MLTKPATLIRPPSLRKNVRCGCDTSEQLDPFIGHLSIREMAHWQANLHGVLLLLISRHLLPGMAPAATQCTRRGAVSTASPPRTCRLKQNGGQGPPLIVNVSATAHSHRQH